jgi:dimethylsulfoniopropionate demethylase
VFLGKEKLKKIKAEGVKKKLMGVKIDTKLISLTQEVPLFNEKNVIGVLRSAGFSPKFNKVVGIAMINRGFWNLGQIFQIKIDNKEFSGQICKLPIS